MKENILTALQNKTTLTLWMNHLLVLYSFLFPISTYASSFIFSLILVLFFIRHNFQEYLFPVFKNPVIQAFILFFLMHILWLIGTENFIQAKHSINVIKYSLFPIIFLSFIDKKFAHFIVSGFIAGILFSELFSYALQLHIIPWKYTLGLIPIYQSASIDDPSPFLNHSHYATSLAFVFIILLYKLIKIPMSKIEKIISLLFILSLSINLSLVGGRIGYLLYLLLIIFLVLYIYRKKFLIPFFIFFILISTFTTLAYNFSPMLQEKVHQSNITIQGIIKGDIDFTTSLGQRIGFWYYSIDTIKENIFFGVGTGDYMDSVTKDIPQNEKNYFIKQLEHPHNIYIQLLLQFGISGLIVFFYLVYQIIKQPGNTSYMQFIKYCIIISILVALTTETFVYRYYMPIFVIIISATIASKDFLKIEEIYYSKKVFLIYFSLIILATVNAKLHFIITALKSMI